MDTKIGELIISHIDKLGTEIGELKVCVNKLEARISALEVRVERLEVRMDKLEARVDKLEKEMKRSFWELEGGLKFIGNRVWDDHEERIKVPEWARV